MNGERSREHPVTSACVRIPLRMPTRFARFVRQDG